MRAWIPDPGPPLVGAWRVVGAGSPARGEGPDSGSCVGMAVWGVGYGVQGVEGVWPFGVWGMVYGVLRLKQ